jgi:hypothetical protein
MTCDNTLTTVFLTATSDINGDNGIYSGDISCRDINSTRDVNCVDLISTTATTSSLYNSLGTTQTINVNSTQMLQYDQSLMTASFGNVSVSTNQLDINTSGALNNVNGLTSLGSTDIVSLTVDGDITANEDGHMAQFHDVTVDGDLIVSGDIVSFDYY